MLELLDLLEWALRAYGPAVIPSLTALALAWHVARRPSVDQGDLLEDYHQVIVENTKVMQHLATLLDERTRRQDDRSVSQDARALRQDNRSIALGMTDAE